LSALREQEQAEQSERSSRQMSALLESLSVGVVMLDGAARVVLMNEGAREVLGLSSLPPAGQPVTETLRPCQLYRPEGAPVAFEDGPFGHAVRGDRFVDEEILVTRADGSERMVLMAGSAVRDEEGTVVSALIVLRDVTRLRELERIREEYVGLISHDLRSPLNVVTLFSSTLQGLLRERGLAEEANSAGRILRVAKRMNAMIQELIDSVRMQGGSEALAKQETALYDRVLAACDQVLEPAQRARVEIEAAEPNLRVVVNADRIDRAIANLLTNALKYAPIDSRVTVRLERRDDEAVVSVTDRGQGIDPVELPKLFDRYFRARNHGKAEGLGLGLYITRLIVEAHGGRVWASSTLGEGSTFFIALPLRTK
jgi:PAS domain S-box-containing protein